MSKNEIKQLAKLVFDCFNCRDFSAVEPNIDENILFNFPGVGDIHGKRRSLLFMKTLLRKYPVLEFQLAEIIAEEEKVVVVWTNTGKNNEGEDYINSGITLFHFNGDKIIYLSDYFKDTSFTNS